MGKCISTYIWPKQQEIRAYIVGSSGAGTTGLLYRLHLGHRIEAHPTIGSNIETIEYRDKKFILHDMAGGCKFYLMRPKLYEGYNCQCLIFVIDSTDVNYVDGTRDELWHMIDGIRHLNPILLVYANKQDLPNAMTADQVEAALNLTNVSGLKWHIQPCSVATGDGLYEGLDWIHETISDRGWQDDPTSKIDIGHLTSLNQTRTQRYSLCQQELMKSNATVIPR